MSSKNCFLFLLACATATAVMRAENPDYEPIIVNPAEVDFAIEGIAVGLIRGAVSTLS